MTESQRLAGEYESQGISVKLWLVTAIALFAVGPVVMGLYFSLFTVRAGGVVFIVLLTVAGIAGAVASLRRMSLASARKKEISEELKKSILREASEEYLTEFRIVPLDELPSNYDLNRMFALNDALDITKMYCVLGTTADGHRFRFLDTEVTMSLVEGVGVQRGRFVLWDFVRTDEDEETGEFYSWMSFRSKKHVDKPLTVQSWDVRNIHINGNNAEVFETEDAAFNRIFCCMCDDRGAAFYALTPSSMHVLCKVFDDFDVEGAAFITFIFDGDWLHVVMKRDDQLTDLGNRDHIDTERRVSGLRREFQIAKRLEELLRDLIC
ncbi:MAG: DUF3137 domain-containing protein [Lachnospiraceae bacterium]|nr:DUF3137 domain-containing protein [Lachnospiraceae bacterium]